MNFIRRLSIKLRHSVKHTSALRVAVWLKIITLKSDYPRTKRRRRRPCQKQFGWRPRTPSLSTSDQVGGDATSRSAIFHPAETRLGTTSLSHLKPGIVISVQLRSEC